MGPLDFSFLDGDEGQLDVPAAFGFPHGTAGLVQVPGAAVLRVCLPVPDHDQPDWYG